MYALQSLPFGWKHSPSRAQAILAAYLVEHYPGSVVVIYYADDVLIARRCPGQVKSQTEATKLSLEQAGWVVSPKSKREPSSTTQWMGKVVGGQRMPPLHTPSLTIVIATPRRPPLPVLWWTDLIAALQML